MSIWPAQNDRLPTGRPAFEPDVEAVEQVMGFDRAKNILELGCGDGQLALTLARRGYAVTGIDLNEAFLEAARQQAQAEGLTADFINRDAGALDLPFRCSIALLLRANLFSMQETDEMNWLLLQSAAAALAPGGRLLLRAPNAAYMLARVFQNSAFDPVTCRERCPAGDQAGFITRRYYTGAEMRWLLRQAGFGKITFFSMPWQAFDFSHPPDRNDATFGVLAELPPEE